MFRPPELYVIDISTLCDSFYGYSVVQCCVLRLEKGRVFAGCRGAAGEYHIATKHSERFCADSIPGNAGVYASDVPASTGDFPSYPFIHGYGTGLVHVLVPARDCSSWFLMVRNALPYMAMR